MIRIKVRGDLKKTKKFLKDASRFSPEQLLSKYGQQGVDALASATPVDTGLTAASWGYEVIKTSNGYNLVWTNSNRVRGVMIAIILQYGHGTRNGGYVQGRDYINPAIRPIFDSIAEEAWKEVTK
jgi:hypothetical protein